MIRNIICLLLMFCGLNSFAAIQTNFFGLEIGNATYYQAKTKLGNEGYNLFSDPHQTNVEHSEFEGSFKKHFIENQMIGIRGVRFGGYYWDEVNLFFVNGKFAYIIFYKVDNENAHDAILDKMLQVDPRCYAPRNMHSWYNKTYQRILSYYSIDNVYRQTNDGRLIKEPYNVTTLEYIYNPLKEAHLRTLENRGSEF